MVHMPSPAAIQFTALAKRSLALSEFGRDSRLRALSYESSQTCHHAALAGCVAAWDTYVKKLPQNFLAEIVDANQPHFLAIHSLLDARLVAALERFNTPNWENSRELIRAYTGYEPINDWVWPLRRMNSIAVRVRLNEILKVRHSFAHGFAMPAFQWNTSPSGRVRADPERS